MQCQPSPCQPATQRQGHAWSPSPITSCRDRPLQVMRAQGSLLPGAGTVHILAPLASLCDLECVCVCVCGMGKLLLCRTRRHEGHVTSMVPARPVSPAAALPSQEAALSSSPRSPLGAHASLAWVRLCLEGWALPGGPPAPASSADSLSTLAPSVSDAAENRVRPALRGSQPPSPPFSWAPGMG